MVRLLQHHVEAPRRCSYLPDERASLEHRILLDVEPDELEAMLARGWRRFGPDYFRPACQACSSCVPTRIDAEGFSPSRSQRRAKNRAAHLRVMIGPPETSSDRLELYHAWHADREVSREWESSGLGAREYFYQFAFPHPAAREVAYYDDDAGGRLVAVGICDETPQAWSAIYCFYDPAYTRMSLGVYNVLTLVAIARSQGKPYVYLGYRVTECPSLSYKSAFHPQETLRGWPAEHDEPEWSR